MGGGRVSRDRGRQRWWSTLPLAVRGDERGQSLPIVLALVTLFFLLGSALAVQASVSLRATAANESQAGDLYAADGGAELGIWWHRSGGAGNPPSITLNGLTVTSTVDVAAPTQCVPTPTATWLTGFESGVVSTNGSGVVAPGPDQFPLFGSSAGTGATADAAVARNGSNSLRVATTPLAADWVEHPLSGTTVVVRFALRLAAPPGSAVSELASVRATAGNALVLGYDAATTRLTLRVGASSASAATATTAAAWHVVELRFSVGGSPRTASWRIDGVDQGAVSFAEAASTIAALRFGSAVVADAYTENIDDVLTSANASDYPLNDGKVVGLRPDAMGTSVGTGDFRNDDNSLINANTWQRLDDAPMTSQVDFVRQRTANTASYIELTFADTAETCVQGVTGTMAYHSNGGGVRHGRTSIWSGATESLVYDGPMNFAGQAYRGVVVTPAAGSWTAAGVNAVRARFGYSSDAAPDPDWDAFVLEVSVGAWLPGTVTVTATAGGSTVTTTYPDSGPAAPTLATWTTTR